MAIKVKRPHPGSVVPSTRPLQISGPPPSIKAPKKNVKKKKRGFFKRNKKAILGIGGGVLAGAALLGAAAGLHEHHKQKYAKRKNMELLIGSAGSQMSRGTKQKVDAGLRSYVHDLEAASSKIPKRGTAESSRVGESSRRTEKREQSQMRDTLTKPIASTVPPHSLTPSGIHSHLHKKRGGGIQFREVT